MHVWCASLDVDAGRAAALHHLLSPDERSRAARLRVEGERIGAIAARGMLRELLAAYLNDQPSALRFRKSVRGKPELDSDECGLRFNLSHSDGVVLYAVAHRREVGVDVERVREIRGSEAIATRWLRAPMPDVDALPGEARAAAFLESWTRAEASVKRRGEGLSSLLARSAGSACGVEFPEGKCVSLSPAPGYVAAVAADGCDWQLVLLHWPRDGSALSLDLRCA